MLSLGPQLIGYRTIHMQPAHQTLITVSLGTAIFLGVAEGASAQAKLSSVSPNEYESISLDSASPPINTLPALAPDPAHNFSRSGLSLPENYAFAEVAEDLTLLEFSMVTKGPEQNIEDASDSALPSHILTAQSIDVEAPEADGPGQGSLIQNASEVEPPMVAPETESRIESEDMSTEQPDDQVLESPDFTAQEEMLMEAEEADDSVPEQPNDPVSVDAELEDLEPEVNDELDEPLVELPDYLLAPANPLFVPIDPETVEIEGTQPISLEQALEIARRNSRELESSLQQLEQSQEALREARAAYLPTISSLGRITHSDTDISNEGPELGSQDGQPTVNTNLILNARVDYDIFTSGQRSANVRAAEDAVKIQELQVEVVREDLRLNITSAYYDLQQSDELVRIAEDTVEQSLRSLSDASARERAGVGTRFDRLQAEVDLANDEQTLSNALRDQKVTRRQLVELLSLPPGIDLSASDPVEQAGVWDIPLEETLVLAYKNRAELEQQLLQRDLENQQARAALANRWPQLSAFADYQLNDLLDNTRVNADNEVLSVGLQMNWTLYNGGATRAQTRQQEIAADLAATQFADTREEIRFEVEEEYLNLDASFKNIQTARSAVDLAKESLRLARLRFGAGVGIQSDVLEAQTRLTEAEVNLVTAILDYNRALVSIQRAVSNFPDNNLSADPVRER